MIKITLFQLTQQNWPEVPLTTIVIAVSSQLNLAEYSERRESSNQATAYLVIEWKGSQWCRSGRPLSCTTCLFLLTGLGMSRHLSQGNLRWCHGRRI